MRLPTAFFLEASTSISSIIHRRAVINHDAVVSIPQTVPPGPPGELYLKYQPYLHVVNGCVPFPAVDSAGNTRYIYTRTKKENPPILVPLSLLSSLQESNHPYSSSFPAAASPPPVPQTATARPQ
jgi:hypothetical protein